jgi:large subunit ribosomal protein L13
MGQIIKRAVSRMLPKNSLREKRMARLKVYPGPAPEAVLRNAVSTWRDAELTALRNQV